MIALLGGSGYIGTAFQTELQRRGWLYLTPPRECYMNSEDFHQWLADYSIQLVINAAGYVTRPSVDLCEDNKRQTLLGNLVLPTLLADICSLTGVPLIHLSTGCLYQGDNGGKDWSETDNAQITFDSGAGFYVGTKELAEHIVMAYKRSYCCRIRLPFDNIDDPRNLLTKLRTFETVVDARNSITHRGDFVRACLDLWEAKAPFGIYNMTNPGFVEFATVCEALRIHGLRARAIRLVVKPKVFQRTARTLKSNCVLDGSKLRAAGVAMRSVSEALTDSITNWVARESVHA